MPLIKQKLCPFSKPISSRWCSCPHATLMERCSSKMSCSSREDKFHIACNNLVKTLKKYSSFIVGINTHDAELTHAQSMKIRCGGILGMQRVLKLGVGSPPVIPDVILASNKQFSEVANFPFNEIVQDIKSFSHRKKCR